MTSGFKHDPLADVSELMQVLRDQYDAGSIPKELIQNADDAKAKSLHLTWATGWPNHAHPLLQGPALVVLNDGVFREQDAEAIRFLRLGAKGSDNHAIGKFGLGLKSVFHLAEVFLYFASESQPASGGQAFASWLNPWDGSKHHRDWAGLEDHYGDVRRWLENWQHGCESWFALWLPLRQRAWRPHIVPEFPVPAEFFRSKLGEEIARAFPLLRHLERVSVWKGGARPVLDYAITLGPKRERPLFPDITPGMRHQVRCHVAITGAS